jgi:hypothetical protein
VRKVPVPEQQWHHLAMGEPWPRNDA